MSFNNKSKQNTRQMTLIGLTTAIICLFAPFSIVLPFSPVPFSLGTLAIYFSAMVLGMKRSFYSTILYLLLGFAGLPVFTGFTGGVAKILGPTGGYMLGYLFIALICGYFSDRWSNHVPLILTGMFIGTVACYTFGTIWLAVQSQLDFLTAFSAGVLPFLPGDFVKISAAVAIGKPIKKRLRKADLL